MRMQRTLGLAAVAIAALAACSRPDEARPMSAVWMKTLYGAIRVERLSPPVASRLMVYATSALYSGLATTHPEMTPLASALNGFPRMPQPAAGQQPDGALAAIYAERVVLDSLLREALPTTRAQIGQLADSLIAARLADGVGEARRAASQAIGTQIALSILAWSRADGFAATRGRPYSPPKGPGLWVNDAPAQTFASQNMSGASEFVAFDNPANVLQAGKTGDRAMVLSRPKAANSTLPAVNIAGTSEPYWFEVRPAVLERWEACPIAPPPAYSGSDSAALYRNAREVLEHKRALTDEQKTIALYWADNAGESGTPVGHWISIASMIASQRRMSDPEAARVLVAVSAAQADAFIASWGYKYKHSLLRPRTYIRAHLDSAWEPLIPTPPFPEYPSGHSTVSMAAAEVLAGLIGDSAFDDSTSMSIGHDVRRFPSFRAAAEEAGMSRIYGGIHFPVGNTAGRDLGACIGRRVVERFRSTDAR